MAIDTEDWDNLSDDDFMAAIDQAGNEPVEEDPTENKDDENIEDTDQNTEAELEETEEAETNEQTGDEAQETEETVTESTEEDDEANTQAENDSEENTEGDKTPGSEKETENEEGDNAEADQKADELDYKAEYAKLLEEGAMHKKFFEEATSEFMANGRKTKGFDDPKKIIQAQQIAAGYSDKMAGFTPYKPFLKTLKEKGMLDSPEKFNLAMQLLEGDPEALKKQIKDFEIDPYEMDMDNINYEPKNQVATSIEVALDDVMDSATKHGVNEQVQKIIGNEWDDESVIELLEDPQNSADLISHLNNGVYDIVQDRMQEKRRVDVNQVYSSKPMIQQYREAAIEITKEYAEAQGKEAETSTPESEAKTESEWIGEDPEKTRQAEEYKAKVEKQNAKANDARRKATSLSKKKKGTRKPKQQVDPLTLGDDEFTDYIDSIAYQK